MQATCPHCQSPGRIRTSRPLSELVKEVHVMCTNPLCGHAFVAFFEVKYTTSLSAQPNEKINLPLSRAVKRRRLMNELRSARQVLGVRPDGVLETGTPPDLTEHELSLVDVMARICGHELRHRLDTARGTFPKPYRWNNGRGLWLESEIREWINAAPGPTPPTRQTTPPTTPASP